MGPLRGKITRLLERELSLGDLLIYAAITALIAVTAIPSIRMLSKRAYDRMAESDYSNVKMGIYNALANPRSPANYILAGQTGPRVLSAPLQGVSISAGTTIDVTWATVKIPGRSPRIIIRMRAENMSGTKSYRYTEVNGVAAEQVTAKP